VYKRQEEIMLSSREISLEDFEEKMRSLGYKKYSPPSSGAYRSWYYRHRKEYEITHVFHLDDPLSSFWYRPLAESMTKSGAESTNKEGSK